MRLNIRRSYLLVAFVGLTSGKYIGKCPHGHVELSDGECRKSWYPDEGAMKPFDSVIKLCEVDKKSLAKLQNLAKTMPERMWKEPTAKFSGAGERLDYKQVSLNFVVDRNEAFGKYDIYPVSKEVHSWMEPILLKIVSQYNYENEVLPPGPGLLNTSIPRLVLARLGPGAKQGTHTDQGMSSRVVHKIHIPLTDAGGKAPLYTKNALTRADWEPHFMDIGYAYEVNNLFPHYAANEGKSERTHLMFEYVPRDVGAQWTSNEFPPTQTEFQAKKSADMNAMTQEERAKYDKRKADMRSSLVHRHEAERKAYYERFGGEPPRTEGSGKEGSGKKAQEKPSVGKGRTPVQPDPDPEPAQPVQPVKAGKGRYSGYSEL